MLVEHAAIHVFHAISLSFTHTHTHAHTHTHTYTHTSIVSVRVHNELAVLLNGKVQDFPITLMESCLQQQAVLD
jgi:hypothetical protein